jgi:hypothetical protein
VSTDPNDFINSAQSVPGAKFETVGDTVKGTVIDTDVRQCTKFGTTEPEWWDDAKSQPKMQLVVTLQTDSRDGGNDDDGRRRIYGPKPSNMLAAIAEALKQAGAKAGLAGSARLEPGGTLAVRFTGERPHEKPGFNPIKEYAAAYAPPTNAAADELLGDGAGTATQPVSVGASASADLLG